MRNRIFLIISFIISTHLCCAAEFSFSHLGLTEGLDNGHITCLAQDNSGFVYAATASGLTRFDGYHFSPIDIQDRDLQTLYFDRTDNLLWIGGETVTILHTKSGTIEEVHTERGKEFQRVYAFAPSDDGKMWIAATGTGIIKYDKDSKETTSLADMGFNEPLSSPLCLHEEDGHYLYAGYGHDGLWRYSLDKKEAEALRLKGIPGDSVYKTATDEYGRIWVATNAGLAYFHPNDMEIHSCRHQKGKDNSLVSDHIYDITVIEGHLWIAADIGGISILPLDGQDIKDTAFINITPDGTTSCISSKNIRSLMQDRFGNVWVGNYGNGIDIMRHSKKTSDTPCVFKTTDAAPAYAVFNDGDGNLWVGGENEIRQYQNSRLKASYSLSPYLQRTYAYVSAISGTGDGHLLLGMYDNGLLIFDTKTGDVRPIPFEKDYIDVNVMLSDKYGKVWIGTENGLYSYSKGELTKEENINRKLSCPYIQGLAMDRSGRLWIGTGGEGVFIFDPRSELIENIPYGTKSEGRIINSLLADSQGYIFAATSDGVIRFDETGNLRNLRFFGHQDETGKPSVRALVSDKAGSLWASTDKGIYILKNGEETLSSIPMAGSKKYASIHNGGAAISGDGEILFASKQGLWFLHPDNLASTTGIQSIVITGQDIVHDNPAAVPYMDGDTAILPPGSSGLTLNLSVIDYFLCQDVEYAYMIDGHDKEWKALGNQHTIDIENLGYGIYALKVKARTPGQEWQAARPCRIIIKKAIPASWLLVSITILITILTILTAYSLKKHSRTIGTTPAQQKTNTCQQNAQDESAKMNMADQRFLNTLTDLIEADITDGNLDIKTLSCKINMSQSTLYRRIKSLTGLTCQEFVRKVRLDNALRLLTDGEHNVSEAAYASGFNDMAYFRACFKKQFGCLPSDYKRLH